MSKRPASATLVAGLSAAILLTVPALLAGCGTANRTISTSSGTRAAAKRGTVTINIKWPTRPVTVAGRVIPVAANSIVLTLTRSPLLVNGTQTAVLTRPTGGSLTSTYTFTNLELGNYIATAQAFPSTDGSGTAQASGPQSGALGTASAPVTVAAGANPTLGITMFATVESLVLSSTPALVNGGIPTLKAGQTIPLTATAYDGPNGTGNIVVTTGAITFSTASAAVATVAATTSGVAEVSTATLTAVANGSTTVSAVYAEPGTTVGTQGTGASATLPVVVSPVGLATPAPGAPAAWPKFHTDLQNTGQALSTSGTSVKGASAGLSTYAVGSQIVYSSPVLSPDGSTLYIGAEDDNFYAVYTTGANAGKVKWTFKTGGPIDSSAAIGADGTIYFGSQDGNVYSIKDKSNGTTAYTLSWKFATGGPVNGSPTLDNTGVLYIASDATLDSSGNVTAPGSVYLLDSLSGAQITNAAGAPLVFSGESVGFNTTPALNAAQTLLYIGGESGTLYALSTKDATAKGAYQLPDTIQHSSPVVGTIAGAERVYQGTTGGRLYAFNASLVNAGPVGSYQATGSILATPAFSSNNGVLYVATYDNSSGQFDSRVAVVDGVPNATTTLLTEISRSAEINPNALGAQAYVFASSPAISADGTTIYVGCENGFIYGFTVTGLTTGMTATGTALPEKFGDSSSTTGNVVQALGNSAQFPILIDSSPAIDQNGHVYIGAFDGNVYVIAQ